MPEDEQLATTGGDTQRQVASPPPPGRTRAGLPSRAPMVVAVVVVLSVALFLGITAYRRASAQSAARADVERAGELIERTDATLRLVDEIVRAQAKPEIAEETAALRARVPTAKREASEAAMLLTRAAPELAQKERPAAADAADAARLRVDLLDAAEPLLAGTEKASLAIGPAEEAWKLLLDAEEVSDRAAKLYNEHDKKKARESRQLTASAAEDVKKAETLFGKAHAAMPEAGLKAYADYCTARLAALELADDADAAFLAGDIAKANSISDKYNARERELAASVKKLPASPAQAVDAAYKQITAGASQRYFAARERLMAP